MQQLEGSKAYDWLIGLFTLLHLHRLSSII